MEPWRGPGLRFTVHSSWFLAGKKKTVNGEPEEIDMHPTYKEIIQDCISEALLLPNDPIQTPMRDLALAAANDHALIIWMAWKWDAEKIDEFETPVHDSDGIITFGSDVESVMAVKLITTGTTNTTHIWAQDEYIAAVNGVTVASDRFIHLAPDSSGNRRIRIYPPDDGTTATYKALALKKYTRATVESTYDVDNPSATPTDYRVLIFPIDRALPALKSAVRDALRRTRAIPLEKNFTTLMKMALQRETYDNARELRVNPKSPMFDEVGEWDSDY